MYLRVGRIERQNSTEDCAKFRVLLAECFWPTVLHSVLDWPYSRLFSSAKLASKLKALSLAIHCET